MAYKETFNVIGPGDVLKKRSRAIEKLVRGILKAEEFNLTRPEAALELVARRLGVAPESIRSTWMGSTFRVELPQSHLNTLEEQARWAMAGGYIGKGPIPNFLPNLYLDALLAVQPERVTVMR